MPTIGFLVIGSLYWDGGDEALRSQWRNRNFDWNNVARVRAPIRYGRRSSTRGNTFSMCFDNECPDGLGYLVKCTKIVNSPIELINIARDLWSAEALIESTDTISASWGTVGTIFKNDDKYFQEWNRYFSRYGTLNQSVKNDGTLNIGWPEPLEKCDNLAIDIILATPTVAQRPWAKSSEVAEAWIDQENGNERYFLNCVRSGIRTFQDIDIWAQIVARSPNWLSKYPDSKLQEIECLIGS